MMVHQDGLRHEWLPDQPPLDLIVTMDDATARLLGGERCSSACARTLTERTRSVSAQLYGYSGFRGETGGS